MRYLIVLSIMFVCSIARADYNAVEGTGAIFITNSDTGETITITK